MIIVKLTAIFLLAIGGQAGCQRQNTSVQDVSTFAHCTDDQGHGSVHPCTTRKADGTWIIWIDGIGDCPAKTKQPKEQVECLNVQK